MLQTADSTSKIEADDLFIMEQRTKELSLSINSMCSSFPRKQNRTDEHKKHCFFHSTKSSMSFLNSYPIIWDKVKIGSNKVRIKALLMDYTKESSYLGSFIGRIISGHWNRHHVDAVSKIIANMSIKNYYESAEDILADLKAIKPAKNGSLFRRIEFIEKKLEAEQVYNFNF